MLGRIQQWKTPHCCSLLDFLDYWFNLLISFMSIQIFYCFMVQFWWENFQEIVHILWVIKYAHVQFGIASSYNYFYFSQFRSNAHTIISYFIFLSQSCSLKYFTSCIRDLTWATTVKALSPNQSYISLISYFNILVFSLFS